MVVGSTASLRRPPDLLHTDPTTMIPEWTTISEKVFDSSLDGVQVSEWACARCDQYPCTIDVCWSPSALWIEWRNGSFVICDANHGDVVPTYGDVRRCLIGLGMDLTPKVSASHD